MALAVLSAAVLALAIGAGFRSAPSTADVAAQGAVVEQVGSALRQAHRAGSAAEAAVQVRRARRALGRHGGWSGAAAVEAARLQTTLAEYLAALEDQVVGFRGSRPASVDPMIGSERESRRLSAAAAAIAASEVDRLRDVVRAPERSAAHARLPGALIAVAGGAGALGLLAVARTEPRRSLAT